MGGRERQQCSLTKDGQRILPPCEKAGLLSRWTFSWVNPVVRATQSPSRRLKPEELYATPEWLSTGKNYVRMMQLWKTKEKNQQGWTSLIIGFGGGILLYSGILTLSSDLLIYAKTKCMRTFLNLIEHRDTSDQYLLYTFAGLLLLVLLVKKLLLNQSILLISAFAYITRSSIMAASYAHLLRARRPWAVGTVLNRLAVDSNRLGTLLVSGHLIWSLPLRVIICFWSVYEMMGIPALYGIAFILLVMSSLVWVTRSIQKSREKVSSLADERLQITSEALSLIKTVKALSLESLLEAKISAVRRAELEGIWWVNSFFAVSAALNFWSPIFAMTLAINAAISISRENLDPAKIFTSARSFQMLMVPMWMIPALINKVIASTVAVNRIDDFLRSDSEPATVVLEPDAADCQSCTNTGPKDSNELRLVNVSFSNDSDVVLTSVNMTVPTGGSLIAVTGPMNSGKSALITGMAGLLRVTSGTYLHPNLIGYCPYPGWIKCGTLKENILFGREFDPDWYPVVLRACALLNELSDDLAIGEAGATVSGGQRQRIALARALYGKPKLLLVDSVLGSLDVKVAKHVFEHCFAAQSCILPEAIRLVVTSEPPFLEQCDQVIYMENGKLACQGTFTDFCNNNRLSLFNTHSSAPASIERDLPPQKPLKYPETTRSTRIDSMQNDEDVPVHSTRRLLQRLIRAAGGIVPLVLLFLVTLGTDMTRIVRDSVLKDYLKGLKVDGDATGRFLIIFSSLGTLQGVMTMSANLIAVHLCMRAARAIHSQAVKRILRARLSVHETTSTGRILNRLGKDLEMLDFMFPEKLVSVMGSFSNIFCTILTIANYFPGLLLALISPFFLLFILQQRFSRTWRALLRLGGQTLAVVSASFSETVAGIGTIQVFGQIEPLIAQFCAYCDDYTMSFFLNAASRRWVSLRCEFIVIFYVGALLVYFRMAKSVDASTAGLLLGYALSAAESMDWLIKHLAEIDHCLVAVERIGEYADNLQVEELAADPLERKQADVGVVEAYDYGDGLGLGLGIEFEKVCINYDGASAVEEMSFKILPRERVAIVGRTGAGKTSLVTALLR